MTEKARAHLVDPIAGGRTQDKPSLRGLDRLHASLTLSFDPVVPRARVPQAPTSIEAPGAARMPGRNLLAWAAAGALLVVAGWLALTVAHAVSFRRGADVLMDWNFLGRQPASQEVSGYLALALFFAALLLPWRHRLGVLSGSRETWRVVHTAVGLLICQMMVVHTGGRLGRGVNLALSIAMLALLVAGVILALVWRRVPPQSPAVGRTWRPLHKWFWWPALGLIAAHVLAVYYF